MHDRQARSQVVTSARPPAEDRATAISLMDNGVFADVGNRFVQLYELT